MTDDGGPMTKVEIERIPSWRGEGWVKTNNKKHAFYNPGK
jgi:hypothetical protein